jgi:hypothetical protein
MSGRKPRHFDPLRNKLPQNWTNSNATKYYNRCWWNKCKCEIRLNADCGSGDKWDPCGECQSKWTKGCSPCDPIHGKDQSYYYTYNRKNCGCSEADPSVKDCSCENNCGGGCDDDVVIRYVANNSVVACNDLVELRIPVNGSKDRYLAKFSDEFVYNNRFQCAIPAEYNNCPGNVIDNRREEEFTESDQRALVQRNIRNRFLAERVATRRRHRHSVPSNVASNGTYYYLGGTGNRQGSNQTGLYGPHITGKPYFEQCQNCPGSQ